MPRKNTTQLEMENQALREELGKLRSSVEIESEANRNLRGRVASLTNTPHGDLMVGIRNVSDYTIGIKAQLPGDNPLQLAAAFDGTEPGVVAVMSYAAWRELRKSKMIGDGMIKRDDSILGTAFNAAPADLPGDLATGWEANLIENPLEWITSRSEEQLRADIEKITAQSSFFRLRRVVDAALRRWELESGLPRSTREEQALVAGRALSALSSKLRMVDDLATAGIEGRGEHTMDVIGVNGRKISLKM